jgi:PAS domain-containing protein
LKPTEPLQLFHSWPIFENGQRFDLGYLLDLPPLPRFGPSYDQQLVARGIGQWECDLADNKLTWSDGVYDIFGLPRGARVARDKAVGFYCEDSRVIMERLRAYSIDHSRGFTVDVQIQPAQGEELWMRLIAAPICEGDRVVRLRGLKQIID